MLVDDGCYADFEPAGPRRVNGAADALADVLREYPKPEKRPAIDLRIEWAADLKPSSLEWHVKPILARRSLSMLYGASGSGKSHVAVAVAADIATGALAFGDAKTRCAGCLIVAAEAPGNVTRKIRALIRDRSLSGQRLPLAVIGAAPDLSRADSEELDALIAEVQAAREEFAAEGAPLGVIFVDTLARVSSGAEENSATDMGALVTAVERLGRETGAAVVLVHHAGKGEGRGPRGSSALFAAMDCVLEVKAEGDLRTVTMTKSKDGPAGKSWAFTLRTVTLEVDDDGDHVTAAVVDWDGQTVRPDARRRPKLPPRQALVLRAVEELLAEGKGDRRPELGGKIGVSVAAVRDRARVLGICDPDAKPDSVRAAASHGRQGLVAARLLHERDGWVCLGKQ